MKATAATIGGVVLLAVIGVGIYLGGWWVTEDSTNRQTGVDNRTLVVQQTSREEVLDAIVAMEDATPGQAQAIAERACSSAGRIYGPVSSSIAAFALTNCNIDLEVNP